jgi:hypothetical protein
MTISEQTAFYAMCGSFILGGLSLFITMLKMILDNRERRSHFRQVVYAKQIEAYTEITRAAQKVFSLPSTEDKFESDAEKQSALEAQRKALAEFREVWVKWDAFLPNSVHAASAAFAKWAANPDNSWNAYRDLIRMIRDCIGIDRLTKDFFQMVGSPRGQAPDR